MTHRKTDLRSSLFSMAYDRLGEDGIERDSGGKDKEVQKRTVLEAGTEEELSVQGYCRCLLRTILHHILAFLSLGVLLLLGYWRPEWRVAWTKRHCSLAKADALILTDADGQTHVVEVESTEVEGGGDFLAEYVVVSHNPTGTTNGLQNGASASTHLTHPLHRLVRWFVFQHQKYVWVPQQATFVRLRGYGYDTPIHTILNDFRGFSVQQQMQRQQLYGLNMISVEVKSYCNLLINEILNPFYVFQIASIVLWSFDNYVLYASCILFVSCLSIAVSLYETRKQSQSLHDMVESSNTSSVTILRTTPEKTTVEVEVSTCELVPGDVVLVPSTGCVMPCDAVLISGNAIVNESMLTGESVPITKTPVTPSEADEIYSAEKHKRHTLFCGTAVIQTRYYGNAQVLAVVVRTGFNTAKGELVRSILYPRPLDFKFYKDSMKFIIFLFMVASIGMSYSVYIYIKHKEGWVKTLVRTLDIVTIVVPPALPAAMTVGTYYAQSRLKRSGIFCISPPRINVSGKIKLVCFDKTGTLTEDGLEVWGAVEVQGGQLGPPVMDVASLQYTSSLVSAMATCHSLTHLHGQLTGDPLDIKMFEATRWSLEEPAPGSTNYDQVTPSVVKPSARETFVDPPRISPDMAETPMQVPYEIGIVRQFPFSSSSQRMSVLVRKLGQQQMDLYVKGAPEVIQSLCQPDTLPENLNAVLTQYTVQGFRVIALAHRRLQQKLNWHAAQRISRDQVEHDLSFVGLLVLQNMLKPETSPVIRQLHAANIRSVMVTGDNILTAISVARDCGMVGQQDRVLVARATPPSPDAPPTLAFEPADTPDLPPHPDAETVVNVEPKEGRYHLAVTGKAWSVIYQHFPEEVVWRVVAQGTIFARMAPDQKAQLVEELQAIDYVVAMCGDGANDCGALKTAHVGISLSEAEASVAAPFTSHSNTIECVPQVICEGRCALTTNFSVFKYMALYSIIQFISVLILYTAYTNLADPQFLYIDLFIVTVVAIFMGYTGPSQKLVNEKPLGSLLGAVNMFSVLSQIFLVILFQVAAYLYLTKQFWFVPNTPSPPGEEDFTLSWETTTIFYVSSFQYLTLCIAYSPGKPFRKPIYTNFWLTTSLLVLTTTTLLMLLCPWSWLMGLMGLMDTPDSHNMFRLTLLLTVAVHFVISISLESFVANSKMLKKCFQWIRCKRQPKNKFKRVIHELEDDVQWPPTPEVPLQGQTCTT